VSAPSARPCRRGPRQSRRHRADRHRAWRSHCRQL